MLRIITFLLAGTFFFSGAVAQSLYIPRNIQEAYKKGTRSSDGRPGKNYWQNAGRYDITVSTTPPERTIRGREEISYINNSPDTLKNIVFRLVLNVHRPGATRMGSVDSTYLTSGLHIDAFSENGTTKNWRAQRNPRTVQGFSLSKPLLPHDSVKFNIDWHYEISLQSNREGMIDSTSFFLAYFYPRVSVYDDYNGWDTNEFTDQQEFYNDFNDYTLTVNVPANYIVWATGDLLNPSEVLQPSVSQKLQQSYGSDSVFHLVTATELSAKTITAQQPLNSWKWKANHISDVTIGLSNHYLWDASSVLVEPGRRVSTQAAYKASASDFKLSVQNANYALDWYSKNWPGVPYPFPKMSVFQGFADMEYPMMVNDASTGSPVFSRLVQDHEIAHSYFPFYMGINESRYAFMDEGWATTLELLIGIAENGKEKAESFYKQFRVNGWIRDKSTEEDIPIITPANVLNGAGYGNNAYGKPSLGYLAMKDLLGDELFRKCLHEYMSRWHGKHPIPWDFFFTLNDASGRKLNWFWNNWYFTNYYIDLAIQHVSKTDAGYQLTIVNIGGFAAPFDVQVKYQDGTSERMHETPAFWQADQKTGMVNIKTNKPVQSIVLDGGIFMDADESNNEWKP
jgi:hypothetical protein